MTGTLGARLTVDVALGQAAAAARTGELERAARVLDDLDLADNVAVLDLRARIHAQLGEWVAADSCWARVQEVLPDSAEAAAGRRMIARIINGHSRVRPRIHAGWAVTGVAAAILAAAVGGIAVASQGTSAAPPQSDRLQSEIRRADALARQLADRDGAVVTAAARRSGRLDSLTASMAMPGLVVYRRADDIELVLDAGAFTQDTTISNTGAALIEAIGGRLTGLNATTTVVGHAVAVPGGPQQGGSPVALARAAIAAEYLAAASGLPLTAFTVATADQRDNPYPDDPAGDRTVTILLRPTD